MDKICVISDTQIPYHDTKATKNLVAFIHAWKPDRVIHIGDFMDFPQPSRWNAGTKFEFEGGILADCELGKQLLADIRDGYSGPFDVVEGNHDLRARAYLEKEAPALAESKAFDLDVLLDFQNYGVELVQGFIPFAPGWVASHGHMIKGLSSIAGNTAMMHARKIGTSVVMGHTHRMGTISETKSYGGKITSQLTGFEVGHLMDLKHAGYVSGVCNWQKGFGVVHVDGKNVTPVPVPIHPDGTFVVDGYRFGK